jgi:hypothetical protein
VSPPRYNLLFERKPFDQNTLAGSLTRNWHDKPDKQQGPKKHFKKTLEKTIFCFEIIFAQTLYFIVICPKMHVFEGLNSEF